VTHDRESAGTLDAHRTCWELLPWLINGRLSPQESQLVETHLARCEECRNELQAQQQLYEQFGRKDALMLAPQASLQKLLARLDADEIATSAPPQVTASADDPVEGAETPAVSPPPLASRSIVTASARSPRWVMTAIAAQGLLIAVLFGALWWQVNASMTSPRFSTLTSEPAVIPHGPAIRVVFAANVEMREVNELLQSLGAQVIAGPGQAGVYTLVLEPGVTPGSDASTVLSSLRSDARVVFAEPAVAGVPSR
jgi:anti-sigma factor RsiW